MEIAPVARCRPAATTAAWLEEEALATACRLLHGHRLAFGWSLLAAVGNDASPLQAAQELFVAAEVVLAHDGGADPCLIYANRAALRLWRRRWHSMVGMPSRLTAEAGERRGRAVALERALRCGGLRGYAGIRVDSGGRCFRIENARLWSLWDRDGRSCGQAACFSRWWWLPERREGVQASTRWASSMERPITEM